MHLSLEVMGGGPEEDCRAAVPAGRRQPLVAGGPFDVFLGLDFRERVQRDDLRRLDFHLPERQIVAIRIPPGFGGQDRYENVHHQGPNLVFATGGEGGEVRVEQVAVRAAEVDDPLSSLVADHEFAAPKRRREYDDRRGDQPVQFLAVPVRRGLGVELQLSNWRPDPFPSARFR